MIGKLTKGSKNKNSLGGKFFNKSSKRRSGLINMSATTNPVELTTLKRIYVTEDDLNRKLEDQEVYVKLN